MTCHFPLFESPEHDIQTRSVMTMVRFATTAACRRILRHRGITDTTTADSVVTFCPHQLRRRPAVGPCFSTKTTESELGHYLKDTLHIDETLHVDLIKALHNMYGSDTDPKQMRQHLENLDPDDVQALVAAVSTNPPRRRRTPPPMSPRRSCTIHVSVPHQNQSFDLQWKLGESLLDLAKREDDTLGQYVEGTCGGTMGCCTCHVHVDAETLNALPEIEETEWDLLEMAYEPDETSRLGCQITLTPQLLQQLPSTVTITIPAGVNNVWND